MQQSTWFTPEGLEDLLPPQAQKMEHYRRQLIDGFHLAGYDLVLPPIAEFTDSLLTGTGRHRATDTCRFTDQESGRMMGVRADMTPQVARIVSNRLKAAHGITRLCYVGEVLKTRNNKAKGSRSPIQVGAELFGHQGVESDIEVIELMLDNLRGMSLPNLQLSLGHVGVVDELIRLAQLNENQKSDLLNILKRKAIPEYQQWLQSTDLDAEVAPLFNALMELAGGASDVIARAKQVFSGGSNALHEALERLQQIETHLSATHSLPIHLDLADIRGYQYHTGVIFGCYSAGRKLQLIAKGGRYDGIGSDFGLSLPATGFSLDLRSALDLLADVPAVASGRVYVPVSSDSLLQAEIAKLKKMGYQVVKTYEQTEFEENTQQLVYADGHWQLR